MFFFQKSQKSTKKSWFLLIFFVVQFPGCGIHILVPVQNSMIFQIRISLFEKKNLNMRFYIFEFLNFNKKEKTGKIW
jgi:hypothetical protein